VSNVGFESYPRRR